MNWIRDGEDAGPFAYPSRSRVIFPREEEALTTTDSNITFSRDLHLGDRFKDDEYSIPAYDEIFNSEGELKVQSAFSSTEDTDEDSDVISASHSLRNTIPPPLSTAGIRGSSRLSSSLEIQKANVDTEQRANITPTQVADPASFEVEATTKDARASSVKDQSSESVQTSKKKKKSKKPRNQKRNEPSATVTKVMPQLELPDPIPSPGVNDKGSGWNSVVGKGIEKATKRMQHDTMRRVSEREYINASSYLTRDNENEMPIRERAAIDVRFGMGGAKHDVRRVVPRSALE